jgi:hypothetical protein
VLGLAGLVLLLGYQNLYFGLDQLNHGTNGYFDLLIPGRYKNAPKDDGSSGSAKLPNGLTPGQASFLHASTGGAAVTPAATTATGKAPQTGGLGVPGVIGR